MHRMPDLCSQRAKIQFCCFSDEMGEKDKLDADQNFGQFPSSVMCQDLDENFSVLRLDAVKQCADQRFVLRQTLKTGPRIAAAISAKERTQ